MRVRKWTRWEVIRVSIDNITTVHHILVILVIEPGLNIRNPETPDETLDPTAPHRVHDDY